MRAEHQMNTDELLSFTVAAGSIIDIDDGVIWMTTSGEDVVLRGGQSHWINKCGEVLVQALVSSRFRLRQPRKAPKGWHRLLQLVGA